MKLVRYETAGGASVGAVEDDTVYPVDAATIGEALSKALDRDLSVDRSAGVPRTEVTLAPPVEAANKVLCVALNYKGHIEETNQAPPDSPILFFKAWESLIGDGADIRKGRATQKLDYEGELAVAIGRECFGVSAADAWSYVGGVTAFNDTSGRDLLRVNAGANVMLDWFSSKCLDRATAVGPWIATADEVGDAPRAGNLSVVTRVNGTEVQRGRIDDLLFDVPALIEFASSRVRLMPGDMIATGTPSGVGMATGTFLEPGDRVEIEIEPLMTLGNTVSE